MRSRDLQGARYADPANPADAAALVRQARAFANAGVIELKPMKGRRLALLSPALGSECESEFVLAATALGAHVSVVRPGLDATSTEDEIEAAARILSQLYDAVECQHLSAALVHGLARNADIPLFDGLAMPAHPTAALVNELDAGAPLATRRRWILQAALLVGVT